MKAVPVKNVIGQGYTPCSIGESTHVKIKLPGPSHETVLPVIKNTPEGTTGSGWVWNCDTEKPTLTPSVLLTSGHFLAGHSGPCWCSYNREHPDESCPFTCFRCHTWIKDGQAQFLDDCSHEHRGKTLELLEMGEAAAK